MEPSNSFTNTNYQLQSQVLTLYADYRHADQPQAVIAIHFTLLEKGQLKLDKTFETRINLDNKSTTSLMNAWNQGLNIIFNRLTQSLQIIL